MQITKSILCLWVGCAISAACAAFIFGAEHVLKLLADGGRYAGEDGPMNISINLPLIGVDLVGYLAAAIAVTGLFLSWLRNKQPLISWRHAIGLLFLLPFALALIVQLEI